MAGGWGRRERQGLMGGSSEALILRAEGSHRGLETEVDGFHVIRLFWLLGVPWGWVLGLEQRPVVKTTNHSGWADGQVGGEERIFQR